MPGLLRRLMSEVHAAIDNRAEAIAGLQASEAAIYERFGYGAATRWRHVEIDRRRVGFADRFRPEPGGLSSSIRWPRSIRSRQSVTLDDPLPHLLTDPRAMKTITVNDFLWLCPRRLGDLLEAPRYRVHDAMVVTWTVSDGGSKAVPTPRTSCRPTTRPICR